jgi:sugar phosphate isomerase/epimerase
VYSKISLNDITIRQAPYAERFAMARQAGFSGVEIWMEEARDYARQHGGFDAVAELFHRYDLRFDQSFLLRDVFSEDHTKNRKRFLSYAEALFQDTKTLGGKTVVACSTFGWADIKEAPKLFAELCDLANSLDLNVALEFIGWAETIKDIKTAWNIVEKAGRKNGGILYDTFHHFFGGSSFRDLEELPCKYIFSVHIVDANEMDLPTIEISRKHRVFPGKGIIPISEILDILHSKKYASSIALELFNEEYWKRSPLDVACEGFESMDRILSKAGFD